MNVDAMAALQSLGAAVGGDIAVLVTWEAYLAMFGGITGAPGPEFRMDVPGGTLRVLPASSFTGMAMTPEQVAEVLGR